MVVVDRFFWCFKYCKFVKWIESWTWRPWNPFWIKRGKKGVPICLEVENNSAKSISFWSTNTNKQKSQRSHNFRNLFFVMRNKKAIIVMRYRTTMKVLLQWWRCNQHTNISAILYFRRRSEFVLIIKIAVNHLSKEEKSLRRRQRTTLCMNASTCPAENFVEP